MDCSFTILESRNQAPLESDMFHRWELPDGQIWTEFHREMNGYLLRFPDIADFQISKDGKVIIAWPALGIPQSTTEHLYLNQVYPLALSRQGKMVFHASAIEIASDCVAFIGHSGIGKSTLAASFATNGFRFLTDDGLRIDKDSGHYWVKPSNPSIRLWEDSEVALSVTGNVAPPLHFTSKSRYHASEIIAFCDQPRLLKRVYFLSDEECQSPQIDAVQSSQALIELVKHSFLIDINEKNMLAEHFNELAQLVDQSIFYRLRYPRDYEQLTAVREMIIQHTTGNT